MDALTTTGTVADHDVAAVASFEFGYPWVDPALSTFDPLLTSLLPHRLASRYCLLPIHIRQYGDGRTRLYVATDDPTNREALVKCAHRARLPIEPMVAVAGEIRAVLADWYGEAGDGEGVTGYGRAVQSSSPECICA